MFDQVKLLGATLDNRLSINKHVNEVSRPCFYHLRALRHIRTAITAEDIYSSNNINRLQRIRNALSRCVVDSKLHRGSNALLNTAERYRLNQCIEFNSK